MTPRSEDTIWRVLEQAALTLPEPFSRHELIKWVAKRRPDVELSSIAAHIHVALAETPNRERHQLGHRPPLLHRVDRGLYRRYRGPKGEHQDVPAETSTQAVSMAAPRPDPPVTGMRVVLVGCSSTKSPTPAPACELFLGQGFQRGRDYALRGQVPWFVLSAKFGLLDPDTVISPYDVYLGDQPASYRRAWGEWVAAQLAVRMPLDGVTVEGHAGETYIEPLREPLRRLGASVLAPLAGLRQGERLAWYRAERHDPQPEAPGPTSPSLPDLSRLLDDRNAVRPSVFLSAGRASADQPGLYTWWVDVPGSHALSAGLGHRIAPGLIYAGRAGGQRSDGRNSGNTLWGRVAAMHLQGNQEFSTFRRTLAAALSRSPERVVGEDALTRWMHDHLGVSVLPLPGESVFTAEKRLLEMTDPPLNLSGMTKTSLRITLSRLRSEGRGRDGGVLAREFVEDRGREGSASP